MTSSVDANTCGPDYTQVCWFRPQDLTFTGDPKVWAAYISVRRANQSGTGTGEGEETGKTALRIKSLHVAG